MHQQYKAIMEDKDYYPKYREDGKGRHVRYCEKCNLDMDNRTEHCSDCQVCISKMDHHCIFFSKCIGAGNMIQFYVTILTLILNLGIISICNIMY